MLKIIEPISFPTMTKNTSDSNKKHGKRKDNKSSFSSILKKILEDNKRY